MKRLRRLLIGFLGLATLACATARRHDAVPAGTGPLIAVYRVAIDDGLGVARRGRLSIWAERPDRLHAELVAPVLGVTFVLDAGGGNVCVVDAAAATAYVGKDEPGAIEALVGVGVSVEDAVAALLDGTSPRGLSVTRVGGIGGALPDSLSIADKSSVFTLARVRFERGIADPRALGTGVPPKHLAVRPLRELAGDVDRR